MDAPQQPPPPPPPPPPRDAAPRTAMVDVAEPKQGAPADDVGRRAPDDVWEIVDDAARERRSGSTPRDTADDLGDLSQYARDDDDDAAFVTAALAPHAVVSHRSTTHGVTGAASETRAPPADAALAGDALLHTVSHQPLSRNEVMLNLLHTAVSRLNTTIKLRVDAHMRDAAAAAIDIHATGPTLAPRAAALYALAIARQVVRVCASYATLCRARAALTRQADALQAAHEACMSVPSARTTDASAGETAAAVTALATLAAQVADTDAQREALVRAMLDEDMTCVARIIAAFQASTHGARA